jgi:hypothetical protein
LEEEVKKESKEGKEGKRKGKKYRWYNMNRNRNRIQKIFFSKNTP